MLLHKQSIPSSFIIISSYYTILILSGPKSLHLKSFIPTLSKVKCAGIMVQQAQYLIHIIHVTANKRGECPLVMSIYGAFHQANKYYDDDRFDLVLLIPYNVNILNYKEIM